LRYERIRENGSTVLFRHGEQIFKATIKGFVVINQQLFYIVEMKTRVDPGYDYDCVLLAHNAIIKTTSDEVELIGFEINQ